MMGLFSESRGKRHTVDPGDPKETLELWLIETRVAVSSLNTRTRSSKGVLTFYFTNNTKTENLQKKQGVEEEEKKEKEVGFNFLAKIFLWDLNVLTVGSRWGKLKMARNDVCCSLCRFSIDRDRGHFTAGRLVGNAQILHYTS